MARLDEFLARWLLRCLKRKPLDGATSALAAQVENQTELIERQRASGTVYLVDRGMKRVLSGEGVMERYHFNEKKIAVVPLILHRRAMVP